MKIHPREQRCRKAAAELGLFVIDLGEKHDLTEAEMLQLVTNELGRFVGMIAKYAIREERHGRTDKPGGLE